MKNKTKHPKREIKFRAWSNKGGCFTQLSTNGGNLNDMFSHPDLVVQQFTGLKDKNGDDIYEGDIVKTESVHSDSVFTTLNKICWDNYGAWNIHSYCLDKSSEREIVGNVLENPELLEQFKQ